MGGYRSRGIRRPGHRNFDYEGKKTRFSPPSSRLPHPERKKKERFTKQNNGPLIEPATKRTKKDATNEFSEEDRTLPRRKRSTEELESMKDHEILAIINNEEKELTSLEMKVEQHEANIKRMYYSLSDEGRVEFWRETYDIFAQRGYMEYMEKSGHNPAIRKTLPISLEYMHFPCLFLAAGDAKIAQYVLALKDMPKDLDILLNQYRLIDKNNPQCPFFDSELVKKTGEIVDLTFPKKSDRLLFNERDEYKVVVNDISEKMLAAARENLKGHKNVVFCNFSATKLPKEFEGRFMTVVVSQFLHLPSMADKMNIIKSIYRALKPGGVAIIVEEEEFKISKGLTLDKISLRLRAVACPIKSKSELISMFTRFEDRDGSIIGFSFMDIGSKWPVDKQPKHVMRSYLFRKPLLAKHFAGAVSEVYLKQEEESKRGSMHNAQHMLRTAIAAADYVNSAPENFAIMKKSQLARVAAITGLLHDFVRESSETGRCNSDVTADLLEYIIGLNVEKSDDYLAIRSKLADSHSEELRIIVDFLKTYREYIPAMASAIRLNGAERSVIFEGIAQMKKEGRIEEALIAESLAYADKIVENHGAPAILRMAESASGERAEDPDDIGGIKKHALLDFALNDEMDETEFRLLAYLGESIIKRYGSEIFVPQTYDGIVTESRQQQILDNNEIEAKVHDAVLQYLKNIFGLDHEEKFLDILLHLDFPKLRGIKKTVRQGISQRDNGEVDATFADEAAKLVIGLAYSKSSNKTFRELGSSMIFEIRNREIRQILQYSNLEALLSRFESYFD